MALSFSDTPSVLKIIDYIERNPKIPFIELAKMILSKERIPIQTSLESMALYFAAQTGYVNAKKTINDPRLREEIMQRVMETQRQKKLAIVRPSKASRAMKKNKISTQENAEQKWKALLELAMKDPAKQCARVSGEPGLYDDLTGALGRKQGGSAREQWFREQLERRRDNREAIAAMLTQVEVYRPFARNQANKAGVDRTRAGLILTVKRQGATPNRGPTLEKKSRAVDVLIHGPHWSKLLPKEKPMVNKNSRTGPYSIPPRNRSRRPAAPTKPHAGR